MRESTVLTEAEKPDNLDTATAECLASVVGDAQTADSGYVHIGSAAHDNGDKYFVIGGGVFGTDGVKLVRVPTNFRVLLKASSEKNRMAYVAIKNKLSSIKGVRFRINGRLEKVNYKGEPIAFIGVARKHIKLWLALDPNEYDQARYYQRDESEKPRYVKVPMLVRIGSDRALSRVDELLNELVLRRELQFKRKYADKTLQELAYTLRGNALIKDKEPWLLRESIHAHDADTLINEDADRYLESAARSGDVAQNMANISLDAISDSFIDGQKVTLEKLKRKGIVSAEFDGYRVTAGERLAKPLHIIADDFSTASIKMIVLTGGRATKILYAN